MKGVQRSYKGCKKCRSMKKKCDEVKPQCGYCKKKGLKCDYTQTLKWGGRPFRDNRVAKKMNFKHTNVVQGICSVNLKAAIGESCTKHHQENSLRADASEQKFGQGWAIEGEQSTFPNLFKVTNSAVSQESTASGPITIQSDLLSDPSLLPPLSPSSPSALPEDVTDVVYREQNNKNDAFLEDPTWSSLESCFMLPNLQLPSLMMSEVLLKSPELADSFDFFVNQTSNLLVPAPSSIYTQNPFISFLPRMAMSSTALMNLLLVFGANHKNKIMQHHGLSKSGPFLVAGDLLIKTIADLLEQLIDFELRNSDATLATVLLLAAFDIFFGDKKQKWRTHVFGARKIMKERMYTISNSLTLSGNSAEVEQEHFLLRWFAYTDIISSLSSTNSINNIQKLTSLKYELDTTVEDSLMQKMINLQDIEYFTGMEVSCLWLLAEVSRLVNEKETSEDTTFSQDLVLRSLELDHKITNYLKESEAKRDEVYHTYYHGKTSSTIETQYDAYRILRATNQIFCLTGVLQLQRRVLGLSTGSPIVKQILRTITDLVDRWIPFGSSAETCIIYCFFTCGCELMDPELIQYRDVYQKHFLSLIEKGVSSAFTAKSIMEDCWLANKQWWDIFKERNLDVTFAL